MLGFEESRHGSRVYALLRARACHRIATLATMLLALSLGGCAPPQRATSPTSTWSPTILDHRHVRMGDGYRLPLRVWSSRGEPKIVVLGLHGFNDHAQAFDPLGTDLAAVGIRLYAVDQRGFGASAKAGHWHGVDRMVEDLRRLIDLLRTRHPDARLYVAGESMGGAVALAALAEQRPPMEGLILIAPAVWSRTTMPWYQRVALEGAMRIAPGLKLTGDGIRIRPSDNIQMLRAMSRDPLVIKATRVDALSGITELMDRAQEAAPRLRTPTLLLYGEHDEVIPRKAFCRFLTRLPDGDSGPRLVLYARGWHMLPRDLQGRRVRADIVAWLRDPGAPLPSGEETPLDGERIARLCRPDRAGQRTENPR
jgi:alpha-beta hydrolase superfamily lysophospholipase